MTDTANASPATPNGRLFLAGSALIFMGFLAVAVAIVAGPRLNPSPGIYVQLGDLGLLDTRTGQVWRRDRDIDMSLKWITLVPEVKP